MSNYRRADIPGAMYFFTVVTYRRYPWFDREGRVEILRRAFRKTMARQPFRVEAMVVLPDHLHCLWQLPEGDRDFSGRWREIKKGASRHLDPGVNARGERPVWQKRFWEHLIRDQEDLRNHMDYIHYNPVRHGLAKRAGDWPWSSFPRAVAKGWYDPDWGTQAPLNISKMDRE
uniref:Putative transposase n=1 Tax=Candidatus Kentrum sp. DK TaxID=2126562 RepID=A0A450S7D0_9GAMM|nr:MAG: putative transposase [Candidatus Kentron sp. DK]VFJ64207.1 MAG: putative transposase [Candidatus Kentron sp. DK]